MMKYPHFSHKHWSGIAYFVLLTVVCIPLLRNRIPGGSQTLLYWLARIEEVKEGLQTGKLVLFPSADLVINYSGQTSALDSNLWLLFPASIRILGGSIAAAYRISMLMVQGITLAGAVLLFQRLFTDRIAALFGVIFYMTCSYRIYLCYDVGDLGQCVVWMVLPLLIWSLCKQPKGFGMRKIVTIGLGAVLYGGICYANSMTGVLVGLALAAGSLWYRHLWNFLVLAVGGLLYLPGAVYFAGYLFKGGYDDLQLPLASIAGSGYTFGQIFSSYAYRPGMPGLGLGLLAGLLIFLWLCFLGDLGKLPACCRFAIVGAILMLCLSSKLFPWDIAQRVGGLFLRGIGLIGSPRLFFGYGAALLCCPAAYAMGKVREQMGGALL